MFRRTNEQQNQNQNRNPDPEILEEQKAENGGIGNEALAELIENELNLSVSNEDNNKKSAKHADSIAKQIIKMSSYSRNDHGYGAHQSG